MQVGTTSVDGVQNSEFIPWRTTGRVGYGPAKLARCEAGSLLRGAETRVKSRRGVEPAIGVAVMKSPRAYRSVAVAVSAAILSLLMGPATQPDAVLSAQPASSLVAFGFNYSGQVGDGTTEMRNLPVPIAGMDDIVAIDAGFDHSLALRSDGRVYAWGSNEHGQLGDGTRDVQKTPTLVPGLTYVTAIGAGGDFSLAIRSDGSVWQWGARIRDMDPSPLPDLLIPTQVATTNASGASLGAGAAHRLVLSNEGIVGWGDNTRGQLSDGTTTHTWSPVVFQNQWGSARQAEGGFGHTVLRLSDGTLRAIGRNDSGQLGDGSTVESHALAAVPGITDVAEIAVGAMHTVARTEDGKVWTWGDGSSGQIGNGVTTGSKVPVALSAPTGVTAIGAGDRSTFAINASGVWFWGGSPPGAVLTPFFLADTVGATDAAGGMNHYLVLLHAVPLQLPTTTSAIPASATAGAGDPLTITATVSPVPTDGGSAGYARLRDGGTPADPSGVTGDKLVDPVTGSVSFTIDTLAVGHHDLYVDFLGTDRFAPSTSSPLDITVSAPAAIDAVAPTTTAPTKAFVVGSTVTSGPAVRFAWSGADVGSGVDHYEFGLNVDGGAYTTVSSSLLSPTLTRALAAGHTYRARVRAIDGAGNVGAWTYGSAFKLSGYQESSRAIRWTGTWRTGTSPSYWGGRDRYATAAGARAGLTFTGRSFAWVGSVGPSRGWARVYVNGTLVRSVNLYAPTNVNRRILFATSWSVARSRTITIRISGTAGHPRGDIDALVVGS